MENRPLLKAELRSHYSTLLASLSPVRREAAALQALKFLPGFIKDRVPSNKPLLIAAFAPFKGEIDLWPVLKEWMKGWLGESRLALPLLRGGTVSFHPVKNIEELSPSLYGFLEPSPESPSVAFEDISMVLVPGLAFDNSFQRLGRGLGFYDKLLPLFPEETPKVGIGFQEQLSETPLPVESHDFPLTDRLLF